MVPKTERFEMRLDTETLNRLDRWAREQPDAPSRAEAVRRLVEAGLARSGEFAPHLTDGDKLVLLTLGEIVKKLEIREPTVDPDFLSAVITEGRSWALPMELRGVFNRHEDDPRDLAYVKDVLEMWNTIEWSHERLSPEDRTAIARDAAPFGNDVTFPGFDGNREGALFGIARFLVNRLNHWPRFQGRGLNAHTPTRGMYTSMLELFEPIRPRHGRHLSADQITLLLRAMDTNA